MAPAGSSTGQVKPQYHVKRLMRTWMQIMLTELTKTDEFQGFRTAIFIWASTIPNGETSATLTSP